MVIEVTMNKKNVLIVSIVCMILIALGYEMYGRYSKEECIEKVENVEQVQSVEEIPNIEAYILGCVNNPGTYEVPKNTTIKRLAEIAGGFTEGADLEKINLVYKLRDNAMIIIKDKNEVKPDEMAMKLVKGVYADEDDMELQVNINTATKEKLTELPGIGLSVAKRIIKYRDDNGEFETIEDLMNVPGIGESKFNSIKDMIVIS